jgi:capsular polysaccharide biosynthesis protein
MSLVEAEIVLPKDYCRQNDYPFIEAARPRPLALLERDVFGAYSQFQCRLAHAFIGRVENARIFGTGFILTGDGHCLLHGLTHGNYPQNLQIQLKDYLAGPVVNTRIRLEISDSPSFLDDEAVLLWGSQNFGHWVFTYLHRLFLLSYCPGLRDKKIVVLDDTPREFTAWLPRLGIAEEQVVRVKDCAGVARLWVPSVLHYRGHYTDMEVYTTPDAVHLFREKVLGARSLAIPLEEKRERIYISRAKARWRQAVNEAELMAALEKLSVRRVFMEELSVDEQIDLVSRAELLLLFAGGASPITMLAPRDANIIEVCLPGFSGIFGSRLWAQILGQGFSRVDAVPVDSADPARDPAINRDSFVPVDKVREMIMAADRQRAGRP